jgi:hypothetical protein
MQIHLLNSKITNANNKNSDLGIFKYMTATYYLISEVVACSLYDRELFTQQVCKYRGILCNPHSLSKKLLNFIRLFC